MYVELHARSAFSFLEATALPEALVERAAALDQPAVALIDRDGLYGAPRLYRAATRVGIAPLVGAEVTLAGGGRLPLLVEDRDGYQNLCRLLTRMKMRAAKWKGEAQPKASRADMEIGRARASQGEVTLDELAEYASGLVALTGGDDGPVASALAQGARGPEAARALIDRLVSIYGRYNVFVEVQRHLRRAQEARNEWLRGEAAHFRLPLLATNEPRLSVPGDRPLLDVLTCIRQHVTLDGAGRLLAANAERHVKPARDMERLFADCPAAVAHTGELALRLGFTLKNLGYQFPEYPLPPGQTPIGLLRHLSEEGRRRRYGTGDLAERARAQIARELDLIGRLDLAGYFLIVWDLIEFCRRKDILVQGRGSAANSAVCYALGITAVDPVGMQLLFERFLSEERGEWPDIDLDLPSGDRRERVIQYVYERYGRHGAAMTANVITYRGRSAAREVGKVLGLAPDLIERLSRLVSEFEYKDPGDSLLAHLGEAGCDPGDLRMRRFAELWLAIQDLPRHLGQHSGGMVICQGRLDSVVPLEPATMPGRSVVQWDKDDCNALGIIKVDLLGLGMMSLLQDAIAMIEARGGALDLAHLPSDDAQVYRMLQEADTIGVFQVESRAQMATLPRLRPKCFYDLVVEVAIIRPGPIVGDMVHPYLRRRAGLEPKTVPHPSLEAILDRTMGVPLFQEQLLRMAMATAGFTGGEAEELRRAMGFKRSERAMREIEVKLRAGMARNGITGAQADAIVRSITAFALYGFPECVVGDTRVLDADTGAWVRIEDVVSGRVPFAHTLACDAMMKLQRRRVLQAISRGPRAVHRVRTALGREITATATHPFLTVEGWRPLGDLRVGHHVAAARSLPELGRRRWPRHALVVLAGLVAEGNVCPPSTVYFYTTDLRCRDELIRSVERFGNTCASVARHRNCWSVHLRRRRPGRPIGAVEWVKRLGLWGHRAHDKQLPAVVFQLCAANLGLLLARLWEDDGHLSNSGHASYDTASRRLADGIQHLLLRLGIISRVYERARLYRGRTVVHFTVTVTGRGHLAAFSRQVGRRFLSPHKRRLAKALATGCLGSGELTRLGTSDVYWDRVISIEPVGERDTYDLEIEEDHNFLANDLVVHNSHAASFALLAYASAYLKAHHPAAFYAALLNNQPMGFYHPATIVRDAERHGQVIHPIDVNRSGWLCAIEPDGTVRLGLRYARGLREETGKRIEAERLRAPFASADDLVTRAGVNREEVNRLAEIGAFASVGRDRRAALWDAARAVRPRGPLYDRLPEGAGDSPLPEMTAEERIAADYEGTTLSLGPHPMRFHRERLARMGVKRGTDLAEVRPGQRVAVAGAVVVRQRPGTAKGLLFMNLEDETGLVNIVVYPDLFRRERVVLVSEPFLLVEGVLQREDNVTSVLARRVRPLRHGLTGVPSHDFH